MIYYFNSLTSYVLTVYSN